MRRRLLLVLPEDVTETECGSCKMFAESRAGMGGSANSWRCRLFGRFPTRDVITHPFPGGGGGGYTDTSQVGKRMAGCLAAEAAAARMVEISPEDAARVASWMDAAIFDGVDEATDPPPWTYRVRDALRAQKAGER